MFLYDCADGNLVACSTSRVDNVEHIFAPNLPAGRYDLQVWKAGGSGLVSSAETYALAFTFVAAPTLTVTASASDTILNWPVYPAGLKLEASTEPTAEASWNAGALPAPAYLNGQNVIWLNATKTPWFFRLRQP